MSGAGEGADARDSEMLLYDHFKHLTSLCLFSLGGGVALADKVEGRSAPMLIVALVVIGIAGVTSFGAAGYIVEMRYTGKPLTRNLNRYRVASPLLLSVGIGMFLYIFARTLKL